MQLLLTIALLMTGSTITAMDTMHSSSQALAIAINPITAPLTYFNELDSRIEKEAQGVMEACSQRSLEATLHHLNLLSSYLTLAEERHDDFSKAYQEKQQEQKRSREADIFEPATSPAQECLSKIIEFKLSTIKIIELFEGMTQEALTAQNWQEFNALLKDFNPVNNQKKARVDNSN